MSSGPSPATVAPRAVRRPPAASRSRPKGARITPSAGSNTEPTAMVSVRPQADWTSMPKSPRQALTSAGGQGAPTAITRLRLEGRRLSARNWACSSRSSAGEPTARVACSRSARMRIDWASVRGPGRTSLAPAMGAENTSPQAPARHRGVRASTDSRAERLSPSGPMPIMPARTQARCDQITPAPGPAEPTLCASAAGSVSSSPPQGPSPACAIRASWSTTPGSETSGTRPLSAIVTTSFSAPAWVSTGASVGSRPASMNSTTSPPWFSRLSRASGRISWFRGWQTPPAPMIAYQASSWRVELAPITMPRAPRVRPRAARAAASLWARRASWT